MRFPVSIRSMQSSLKNNDRRKKRKKMDQPTGFSIEKTKYDIPEFVSDKKRKKIVNEILKKRSFADAGKGMVYFILILIAFIFVFFSAGFFFG